uniref:Ovomucoid n=1 Tax=Malurus cyaneus samueli TaxID=2593467 RepID=A0A8C5UCX1_9PASS
MLYPQAGSICAPQIPLTPAGSPFHLAALGGGGDVSPLHHTPLHRADIDCTGFLKPGSGFNQMIDCSQQKGGNMFCTSEYNPICGSDGRTYGNKCKFCNAVSRSSGALFFSHQGAC